MAETITKAQDEARLIQNAYRKVLKFLRPNTTTAEKKQIRKAYELAVDAHKEQRRKSGEPYILHPIAVAEICAKEIGLGATAIICAFLHDVVEDTDVTLEYIEKEFGAKVGMIVDGLTKFDNLYDVKSPQAENFKKILSTLATDVRVVLVKMADRLHNMRTLGAMKEHKQLKIASETEYIYAPLAHRLGLYNFRTEFQDCIMKIKEKELFNNIEEKLAQTEGERSAYINRFISPIQKELEIDFDNNFRIFGRSKSISSIANKLKKKSVAFENIYDLFAVRIVLDIPTPRTEAGEIDEKKLKRLEKNACWEAYSIITDIYRPIPERLKDWVTTPKSNGYESLHTTVIGPDGRFVEVQVRSERMDEISEKGFAAHWKYKGVHGSDSIFDVWLANVREFLNNPSEDAVEFLEDFRANLYSEGICVYTPTGEPKVLPLGATPLDFAFTIHSDVGYHCVSAKVNHKMVPLSYKLQSGERVSITTSPNQKPNKSWLNMVVTGKARSKIRLAMREEQKRAVAEGKEILVRKLNQAKVDFERNTDLLYEYCGYQNRLELYGAIVAGKVKVNELLKNFRVEAGNLIELKKEQKVREKTTPVVLKPKNSKPNKSKLTINDQDAAQYKFEYATCCKPVQGDPVFAYLTAQNQVKIHRFSCKNSTNLMSKYGYRILKAGWVHTDDVAFVANLIITGQDGKGVVQNMTDLISNYLKLDMRSISMDGDDGYFRGRIGIVVNNTDQLNFVIQKLSELKGVSNVSREE